MQCFIACLRTFWRRLHLAPFRPRLPFRPWRLPSFGRAFTARHKEEDSRGYFLDFPSFRYLKNLHIPTETTCFIWTLNFNSKGFQPRGPSILFLTLPGGGVLGSIHHGCCSITLPGLIIGQVLRLCLESWNRQRSMCLRPG